MEEIKKILTQSEIRLEQSDHPFHFVKTNTEIIPVENEKHSKIYIPQELFSENEEDFKKYFDRLSSEYLDIKNTDIHKEIILQNDFTFKTCPLDALEFKLPDFTINHDLIDIITDTVKNPLKSYKLEITKEKLIETINTSYNKQKHFKNGILSHQDFINFITTNFDRVESKYTSNNVDVDKAKNFKYDKEINEILKMTAKNNELSESISLCGINEKIVEADDFLIEKFEEIRHKMVIKFPFELDDFQKKSVYLIEKKENVLVAAHTSAGKTVMAEYAIASSISMGKKTIYTSPIKALSNQKFYEFRKMFSDVGIITGDIQINENANTIVMTTEILRSMLYRDSSQLNDLAYVIFDEVHYINDAERGVVWEEILIMLPKHIRLVLLSATVPNCHEVAQWIGEVRQQVINVVITRKRPVPLEHILYFGKDYQTKDNILKIIDSHENFSSLNYRTVEEIITVRENKNTSQKNFINKGHIFALVDHLYFQSKLPCIIFTFSRQKCFYIGDLLSHRDFTTKSEKHIISSFFQSSLSRLTESNRKLYQVRYLQDLCMKGIAVHHSGVLPILREIVELLFQKELIKVLIATETFAIGVNMPAKSVVFTSLEKFSGNQMRPLLSSEYIQMAGRAGRRGQDIIGSVYVMTTHSLPSEIEFRSMAMGSALKITSRFRLTYGMILNLLSTSRLEETRVEHVMKSSFNEFIQISCSQEQLKKINKLKDEVGKKKSLCNFNKCCEDLEYFCDKFLKYKNIWKKILILSISSRTQTKHFYLQCRLGFVRIGSSIYARPCVILDIPKPLNKTVELFNDPNHKLVSIIFPAISSDPHVDTLLEANEKFSYVLINQNIDYEINSLHITDVLLGDIIFISSRKMKINIPLLKSCICSKNNKLIIIKDQTEALKIRRSFLDFLKDIKNNNIFTVSEIEIKKSGPLEEDEFEKLLRQYSEALLDLRNDFKCLKCKDILPHSEIIIDIKRVENAIEKETLSLSDGGLSCLPEYNKRVEILKRLELIDENLKLTIKGRVAVKFTNNFEIILTELLFDGTIKCLNHSQLAALLSCFTDQGLVRVETTKGTLKNYELDKIWDKIDQVLCNLDEIERDIQLVTCERPVHPKLMKGIYEWALGCDFEQLVKTTQMQEGSLIRFVLRLDEICKELEKAALHIGNLELKNNAKKVRDSIRRDIVNIPSLYLID